MVVNEIYYTQAEMRSIFKHYGKVIKDDEMPYSEKIPYELFRRLTNWDRGIVVKEDENKTLWFYENDKEEPKEPYLYAYNNKNEPMLRLATNDSPLVMGITDEHDFYHFFRAYYYDNHSDYVPTTKEDNDMATTISWNNNKDATFTATNALWNMDVWDEAAEKATCSLSNYQNEWTDAYTQAIASSNVNKNHTVYSDYVSLSDCVNVCDTTTNLNDVNVRGNLNVNGGKLYLDGKEIEVIVDEVVDNKLNKQNEKENTNMKGFNFDFGPCTNNDIRMSMYGIAVKNVNGEWVSYNPQTEQIINVDIFNFDGRKYMFKMPVALKDVAKGDVIIHQRKAMFVVAVEDNGLVVVDVMNGEEKKVIPTSNMFGFDFVTKIVSMFNAFAAAPTPDAPFGNFLPFMLMGEDNKDIDPMMLMMMMNNGGDMFSNPMMMYFLAKDGDKDSMLPLMFMMNQNNAAAKGNGKN